MTEYDEETEQPYQRLEVTVGVMVPFEWDAEAETYRLQLSEVVSTTGGLFSDAEEGMWVQDVDEWLGAENAEMNSAFIEAWRFVDQVLAATREKMQA